MTIYLDHNATSPIRPEVATTVAKILNAGYANPASPHQAGRKARAILEDARESIIELLGAKCQTSQGDTLIFTSGGTEANNLALFGLAGHTPGHVIISSIEHPSVSTTADELVRRGFEVTRAPVLPNGVINLEQLASSIGPNTRFVSAMTANHETGVLQPIQEISQICHVKGVLCHTDAVQAAGKIAIDFTQTGVDAMTISAHKFGGPVGVGALLLRHGVQITPQIFGGHQQSSIRPGTESLAHVVGMQRALELAISELSSKPGYLSKLRDSFEHELKNSIPGLQINCGESPRTPQTSNIAFPGCPQQEMAMALDMVGVACSTGSACASGSSKPSPTLLAMGCNACSLEGSLRFGFGPSTSPQDVTVAIDRIIKVFQNLQAKKQGSKTALPGRGTGKNSL